MKLNIQDLIADLPVLASSSQVYEEFTAAVDDSKTSINDFGKIIEKDPDLTARLLRLANSAFFGFTSGVKTVGEAVIMIGIQQIRDLMTATVVVDYFQDISQEDFNMESFWKHSVVCGISSRVLASYRRNWNPEQSFAAGLMHDLGRLVLFMRVPDEVNSLLERYNETPKPLYELEREFLGFDHAEIGGHLLDKWNLPVALIDAVRFHHEPMKSELDPVDASIVHFGDILAHGLELGTSGEKRMPPPDSRAWDVLELKTEILYPCLTEIEREYKDVVETFLTGVKSGKM